MALTMAAERRPPDPVPGQQCPSTSSSPTAAHSGATPAWAGGNTGAGISIIRRPYQQIINESNSPSAHLLIQFKLKKLYDISDPNTKPINLTDSQIGEFVWEFLQIPYTSCIEIDNQTGRYDTRELLIKSGTNLTKVITSEPHVFKEHEIFATLISNKCQRVFFKGVPIGVPDEELQYLCEQICSMMDGKVHREQVRLVGKDRHAITSSTRYVEVKINPGKFLKNYYWLAAPGQGEVGRRVFVQHPNQPKQCHHCFRYPPTKGSPLLSSHCKGGGNGKMCEKNGTPRTKMSDYIADLKTEGYKTLRAQHYNHSSTAFPALQGSGTPPVDLDMELVNSRDLNDDTNDSTDPPNTATPHTSPPDISTSQDTPKIPSNVDGQNDKETEPMLPLPAKETDETKDAPTDDSVQNDKTTEQLPPKVASLDNPEKDDKETEPLLSKAASTVDSAPPKDATAELLPPSPPSVSTKALNPTPSLPLPSSKTATGNTVNTLTKQLSVSMLKMPSGQRSSSPSDHLLKRSQSDHSIAPIFTTPTPVTFKQGKKASSRPQTEQGLILMELPLVQHINQDTEYTDDQVRQYTVKAIRDSEITYRRVNNVDTIILSKKVLKGCKENSVSSSAKNKQYKKIEGKVLAYSEDATVRREALEGRTISSKARTFSESEIEDDDIESNKVSRTTSPPKSKK